MFEDVSPRDFVSPAASSTPHRAFLAVPTSIRFESGPEPGFVAIVPGLPGCVGEGDTREEALEGIQAALVDLITSYGGVDRTPWLEHPEAVDPETVVLVRVELPEVT